MASYQHDNAMVAALLGMQFHAQVYNTVGKALQAG